MGRPDLVRRVQAYPDRKGLLIGKQLGSGVHGIVFSAEYQTEGGRSALKVHERHPHYQRERDVYLRLKEHGITEIRGCNVPELVAYDDELWVIEMTVVTRPFVLDFAGAYLDQPPDFSEKCLQIGVRRNRSNSVRAGLRYKRSSGFSKVSAYSWRM
jgi:hypothetical protein